jgi:hypothetical protein
MNITEVTKEKWNVMDLRSQGRERLTIYREGTIPEGDGPVVARIENSVSGRNIDDGDVARAKLIMMAPRMYDICRRVAFPEEYEDSSITVEGLAKCLLSELK